MSNILSLLQGFELRHFAAGEIVLEEGTKSDELLFLAEGSVEIVKGGVLVTTVSQPGAVFGEISALLGCRHTATVRAIQPCSFYIAESPREFVEASPAIWRHVSASLARRLDAVNSFVVQAKRRLEGREHAEILNCVLDALMQRTPPRLIRVPARPAQPEEVSS